MTFKEVEFPSPTGVNYYECNVERELLENINTGFRPQQGLTIMNGFNITFFKIPKNKNGFRPQQGLTIMNIYNFTLAHPITVMVSVPNRG